MNNLYVRLAKNNLKNNKSLYVPYMVAGMITVLMFYIMMFINNSACDCLHYKKHEDYYRPEINPDFVPEVENVPHENYSFVLQSLYF